MSSREGQDRAPGLGPPHLHALETCGETAGRAGPLRASCVLCPSAKLQVPGVDSDEESKTPSASPRHGRSRPSSSVQESSSESEDGDSRGEVRGLARGGGRRGESRGGTAQVKLVWGRRRCGEHPCVASITTRTQDTPSIPRLLLVPLEGATCTPERSSLPGARSGLFQSLGECQNGCVFSTDSSGPCDLRPWEAHWPSPSPAPLWCLHEVPGALGDLAGPSPGPIQQLLHLTRRSLTSTWSQLTTCPWGLSRMPSCCGRASTWRSWTLPTPCAGSCAPNPPKTAPLGRAGCPLPTWTSGSR